MEHFCPTDEGVPPLAAFDHLGTSEGAGRSDGGLRGRISTQQEALARWLESQGRLRPYHEIPGLKWVAEGAEHIVFHAAAAKRAIKLTKPNRFGHSVKENTPATPAEYLLRLTLQNEIFGDDIRLLGAMESEGHFQLVTSQPWIPDARGPDQQMIDEMLLEFGFYRSPSYPDGFIYFSESDGLLLVDAQPHNVVLSRSGDLLPIDVVIGYPEPGVIERLARELREFEESPESV